MSDEPTPPPGNAEASLVVADTPAEFFIAGRQLFQDATVSLEARAIVGYVLSRPPTWKVRVRDLMKQGDIGRDKLRRIFKELIKAGYMKRERVHVGGRLDWRFTVSSVRKFGVYEKQCTEKQSLEIQATENTAVYKTKNVENKESSPRESKSDSRGRRASVKTFMPDEFKTLTDELRAVAFGEWGRAAKFLSVEQEHAKFVADAESQALKYVNWSSAWRKRCVLALQYATRDGLVKPDEVEGQPGRVLSIAERRQAGGGISKQ